MKNRSLQYVFIIFTSIIITTPCLADQQFASLKLATEPEGATAILDGVNLGKTPLETRGINPGKHFLVVLKNGYRVWTGSLDFEAGKRQVGNIKLVQKSKTEIDSARAATDSLWAKRDTVRKAAHIDNSDPHKYTKVDRNPEPLYRHQPTYPEEAKFKMIEGEVFLMILIDTTGAVVRTDIGKSSGSDLLDFAATEAAYQWKFSPAIAPGNKRVRVWVTHKFTFKLNQNRNQY